MHEKLASMSDDLTTAQPKQRRFFSRMFQIEWPDSLWLNLAISVLVGFLYALYLVGPHMLDPRNVSWLYGDPATYYIGWAIFRQDTHIHWPITFTDRIGYPIGDSISLMDVNPLLAILFKVLSPILPHTFQYLGIEVVLSCVLQFFFALRLFRLLLGPNPAAVVLPSLFFLTSPPMTLRIGPHQALSNHWLLTAALFVFFLAHQESPMTARRFAAVVLTLGAISVSINPYLAFQVMLLLVATILGLIWRKRLKPLAGIGLLGSLGLASFVAAYAFGFIVSGAASYTAGGYRTYSMNLLSPFNPFRYGSLLMRPLPVFVDGQYEGYCYLGAGVMLLSLVVVLVVIPLRSKIHKLSWRSSIPLLLCCFVLVVMAFSTEVTIGSKLLVDLDPSQRLSPYLAVLRCSGRLSWAPYYVVLAAVLVVPFWVFDRRWATALVAVALAIQFTDLIPFQRWVRSGVNQIRDTPLKSEVWTRLGSSYQNLIVLPPWQCSPGDSPGGRAGFSTFGILAANQKMRINSYYSARYTAASLSFHCGEPTATLIAHFLSTASVYVVTPRVAGAFVRSGFGNCHNLDGFVLCSAKDDLGLGAAPWKSQVDQFVSRCFKAILEREPTHVELAKWTKALDQDERSAADFIDSLLGSPEFERRALPRLWAFLDAHGRWPALAEWTNARYDPPNSLVRSGGGGRTKPMVHDRNSALVYMLYFAILDRNPDWDALSNWPKLLGQTSLQSVTLQLLSSAEYKAHSYLHYQ
jgi:hypothetical protein